MEFSHNGNNIEFSTNGDSFYIKSLYADSCANLKEYGLVFLSSPYYDAELDYHEVFISGNSSTAGWIIPLALLEESDQSVIDSLPQYAKMFSDIAIKKLITCYLKDKGIEEQDSDECILSKMYSSDIVLLIYRKSIIPSASISAFIPSLYDAGYYINDNPYEKSESWYKSDIMIDITKDIRTEDKHKVTLKTLKTLHFGMDYIGNLYKTILPVSQDIFQRFIVLYQVMEILMEEEFEIDVFKVNVEYAKGVITKNALRQKLIESTSEDTKITRALDGVHEDTHMIEFKKEVSDLLDKIKKDYSDCKVYAHYLYKMRNTVVHSLREIVKYDNSLQRIIELLEKNIFNILCTHTIKEDAKDMLFYADISISKKSNVRRFRNFLNDKGIH